MSENKDFDNVEELELIDGEELKEISPDELEKVSGGKTINKDVGVYTRKLEAEMIAEVKFRVGCWYTLKCKGGQQKKVQCYSTGAEYCNGYYMAVCYFRTQNGGTGWATINHFVCR